VTRRTLLLSMRSSAALVMLASVVPSPAAEYRYTAVTEAAAAPRQGTVRAGTLMWQCKGNRCTIAGNWPTPAVPACHALALAVGRLRSYGHPTAQLDAVELAKCNEGVKAASVSPAARSLGVEPPAVQIAKRRPAPTVSVPEPGTGQGAPSPPTAVFGRSFTSGATFDTRYSRWTCSGNRCTTARLANTEFAECQALAQSAGPLVSFEAQGRTLAPADLARCNSPVVDGFNVTACSGDDDLRGNSTVQMTWIVDGRPFDVARGQPLFDDGIASHTCAVANFDRTLVAPFPLIDLRQIVFDFHTVQGRGIHIESPDNWDMAQISIQARVSDPGGRRSIIQLVDQRRTPAVYRFQNIDRWYAEVRH
jgi:hypothetical protein